MMTPQREERRRIARQLWRKCRCWIFCVCGALPLQVCENIMFVHTQYDSCWRICRLQHCSFPTTKSYSACISPSPGSPVLPLGPSIPVSHVLSVRLQALLSPVPPSLPIPLPFLSPPPFLTLPVCLPLLPQSSTSTSILHGPFSPLSWFPLLNLTYLSVSSDEFMLYFSTSCSV